MKIILSLILSCIQLAHAAEIKTYLSFHACHQSKECHIPQNHQVFVAEGTNFKNWQLLPGINGLKGSVPDLVKRDHFLYIYHTPSMGIKYDLMNKKIVKTFNVRMKNVAGHILDWVDPSAHLSTSNNIALTVMLSKRGGDPARCQPHENQGCVKNFMTAKEIVGSDGEEFELIENSGMSIQIQSQASDFEKTIASDPDLLKSHVGEYVLLVSRGQSIGVYMSPKIIGPYQLATAQEISFPRIGGVPASVYFAAEKLYYTFTTSRNHQSGNREIIKIYRHAGWGEVNGPKAVWDTLSGSNFPELGEEYSLSSPGIEL